MKIINSKNIWAIKLTKNTGIFFCYQGRESYGQLRSWDWTKYDFLDHVGFEFQKKYFGKEVLS